MKMNQEIKKFFITSTDKAEKCEVTSECLVSLLLPMLKNAIESNETKLTEMSLDTASKWIKEIVEKVKDMVDRYEQHKRSLASCTSDVIQEKTEKEQNVKQQSEKIKNLEEEVTSLKEDLKKKSDEIEENKKKIDQKNAELKNHFKNICHEHKNLDLLAALIPFVGHIIDSFICSFTGVAQTTVLKDELSQLSSEKSNLRKEEWKIQVNMTNLQMQLATLKIQQGTTPDPVYLEEVQLFLSHIQQVLLEFLNFWKSVNEYLESLKKQTMAVKGILSVENLSNIKAYFLKTLDIAEKNWQSFGKTCLIAKKIFSSETKDAYKFLGCSPSPGSEEWEQEYKSVIEKLNEITLQPICNAKK